MATVTKQQDVEQLEKLAELHNEGALSDQEFAEAKAKVFEHMTAEPAPIATQSEAAAPARDVIGTGRYVLSFVLAGVIGLGVAYLLRNQGWLAIWINAVIGVIAWVILLSA
jgi:hypothetical protein